jgi:hypothetical protein
VNGRAFDTSGQSLWGGVGGHGMPVHYKLYLGAWSTACLLAIVLMLYRRETLELFQRRYWLGLFQGWKLESFALAAIALVLVAPYTIDPTWDYIDAGFMSILTYTTAPWVVAALYRTLRKRRSFVSAYIAVCIWLFSVSWSYDLYILLRDGHYPATWLPNIFLSSIMYLAGGLFWSLEYIEGRGVIFGFMDARWPLVSTPGKFTHIVWYSLPFIVLVVALVLPFI